MFKRLFAPLAALVLAAASLSAAPSVQMPEFVGISRWFNGSPTKATLRGHVVLVDFWTYSCVNCLRTLPYLKAWYERYHSVGLELVGVHAPEFPFEQDPNHVGAAIAKLGIHYPVGMDNEHRTWNAYLNRYWPAEYLVDRAGVVRFQHFGEGNYQETEQRIRALLSEGRPDLKLPPAVGLKLEAPQPMTPEIYLGSARLSALGNGPRVEPGAILIFALPSRTELHHFYLQGQWRFLPDYALMVSPQANILIRFQADQANMVLSAEGQPVTAQVLIDGQPATTQNAGSDVRFENGQPVCRIEEPRLYTLAQFKHASNGPVPHTLELRLTGAGLRAYTFTFG